MKVRQLHKNQRIKRQGGPNIGHRHKVYEQGCAVCEAYSYYDALGRFPRSFVELSDWEAYLRPEGEENFGDMCIIPQESDCINGHVPRIVVQEVAEILTIAREQNAEPQTDPTA